MQRGSALFFILIFLAIFFLLGGVFLVFYLSNNSQKTVQDDTSLIATQSAQVRNQLENLQTSQSSSSAGTTSGEKVSFVKKDGKLYFKLFNRIYGEEGDVVVELPNSETLSWQTLLDIPKDVNKDSFFNEAFSFKAVPNSDNFFLVIRWDRKLTDDKWYWEFPVYYFNAQERKLTLLFKTDTKSESLAFNSPTFKVPRIDQVSKDGNYVSFNMFGCWNCGGHTPEYVAFDVRNKTSKNLGNIVDFSWLENGEFQYKTPQQIACPETEGMQPDKCFEDKNNVPFIKESF